MHNFTNRFLTVRQDTYGDKEFPKKQFPAEKYRNGRWDSEEIYNYLKDLYSLENIVEWYESE